MARTYPVMNRSQRGIRVRCMAGLNLGAAVGTFPAVVASTFDSDVASPRRGRLATSRTAAMSLLYPAPADSGHSDDFRLAEAVPRAGCLWVIVV